MVFDQKNKHILFELFQNARQSNLQISKKVGVPEKSVANRINKLLKEGVIKSFTSMVNYQKLGFNRHSIYLDLKSVDLEKVNKKIKSLLSLKEVSCCYFLHDISQWKVYLSIWTKTIAEYDEIQTQILTLLKDDLLNYVSFQSVRSYTYLARLLNPTKNAKCDIKEGSGKAKIDDNDWKLIELLRKDSRMPLLELAKKLGVHVDTAKRKMKKLVQLDVLQRFYPLVNLRKIGLREYTFIARLNPSEDKKIEEFIHWARTNPHFVIIIKAVGWVNLYYAFQTENDEQFKKIRTEIAKRIGHITLKEYRIEVEEIIK